MTTRVDKNLIKLSGDVDTEMYDRLFNRLKRVDLTRPVTIVLNTGGGDFYQGLAIYDLLTALRKHTELYIVAEGHVMSTGIAILQAATVRHIRANCYLMVHYGEDSQESLADAEHNRELVKKYKDIILSRVTVTKRTVSTWLNKNTYFNAERAIKAGLVDESI